MIIFLPYLMIFQIVVRQRATDDAELQKIKILKKYQKIFAQGSLNAFLELIIPRLHVTITIV